MKRLASIRGCALPITAIVTVLIAPCATRIPHLTTGPLDVDEDVYWLSMRSLRAGNPLFTSVYSSQPPAFLLVTEPPWDWLGGPIEAGRAVMLEWSVLGIGAGAVLGWCLGGRLVGVVLAVTGAPRGLFGGRPVSDAAPPWHPGPVLCQRLRGKHGWPKVVRRSATAAHP